MSDSNNTNRTEQNLEDSGLNIDEIIELILWFVVGGVICYGSIKASQFLISGTIDYPSFFFPYAELFISSQANFQQIIHLFFVVVDLIICGIFALEVYAINQFASGRFSGSALATSLILILSGIILINVSAGLLLKIV